MTISLFFFIMLSLLCAFLNSLVLCIYEFYINALIIGFFILLLSCNIVGFICVDGSSCSFVHFHHCTVFHYINMLQFNPLGSGCFAVLRCWLVHMYKSSS